MDTLLVYSFEINNRINFVFTHIFFRMLKLDFMLTGNISDFKNYTGPRVSYCESRIADEFHIKPFGLLSEPEIKEQNFKVTEWDGLKIFCQVEGDSDLPFDIFSAVFFMLSRYEEYYSQNEDKFGRFEAKNSLAFNNGFLHEPIVEKWALNMREKIKSKFTVLEFSEWKYSFQSTIDIDNPFAFLHKGFIRTIGALLKSLIRLDIKAFISRLLTIQGARKDPYVTYDYIKKIERKSKIKSIYFFLVGDYSRYDTNIPVRKLAYQNLIIDIHEDHNIGLHSSFNSNKSFKTLLDEKQRLTKIINEPIIRSRQHYLMLDLPFTYQKLIEAGIKEDYSMGFASMPGFRAGTCTPFKFYDLSREEETGLMVYPFQVMEVALHHYMRLKPMEAMEPVKKIIDEIKSVNGQFISLWHNESLSEYGMWLGWRKVFEQMIRYASS